MLGSALHRLRSQILFDEGFNNGKAVFDGVQERRIRGQHVNFQRRKFFDNSPVHRGVVHDIRELLPPIITSRDTMSCMSSSPISNGCNHGSIPSTPAADHPIDTRFLLIDLS